MSKYIVLLLGLIVFVNLTPGRAFAQSKTIAEARPALQQEWVLGDVIALDLQAERLVLAYLDYDNLQEERITISIEAKTNYENLNSLQDIKLDDVLAIDYEVDAQGKATALNISKVGDDSA